MNLHNCRYAQPDAQYQWEYKNDPIISYIPWRIRVVRIPRDAKINYSHCSLFMDKTLRPQQKVKELR